MYGRPFGIAVDLHQPERLDGLRLPFLANLEIRLGEIHDRTALLVRHDHVHTDRINAASEDGRWSLRCGAVPAAGGCRRRLLRGRLTDQADPCEEDARDDADVAKHANSQ